jgi:hypothetical protein
MITSHLGDRLAGKVICVEEVVEDEAVVEPDALLVQPSPDVVIRRLVAVKNERRRLRMGRLVMVLLEVVVDEDDYARLQVAGGTFGHQK